MSSAYLALPSRIQWQQSDESTSVWRIFRLHGELASLRHVDNGSNAAP